MGNELPKRNLPKLFLKGEVKQLKELPDFKDRESKFIVNKTILDNGFLLIEQLKKEWDDSSWINDKKYSYTYDVNNNEIEELHQNWSNSNWENSWKWSYIYSGNNNRIGRLYQTWEG